MLIQKLRLQRGWSQEQLAELSGLSVRTIQRLERGQPASVESLKALGAVLEIDFSNLKEPDMSAIADEAVQTTQTSMRADEALPLLAVATGASLELFSRLHDDKYYRAFNILNYEV